MLSSSLNSNGRFSGLFLLLNHFSSGIDSFLLYLWVHGCEIFIIQIMLINNQKEIKEIMGNYNYKSSFAAIIKKAMIQIKKEKCEDENPIISLQNLMRRQGFQKFRQAELFLSQDYEPDEILCRKDQMNRIRDFIQDFMETGYAKESLYISGVPGIGKTLSVNKVIEQFKDNQQSKKAKVKFVKLNAMKLKHPGDIYKNLYNGLLEQTSKLKKTKMSEYSTLVKLDTIFRSTRDDLEAEDEEIKAMKKVVVIDQIDYLKTKDEEILYNIFDWTQSEASRLAIISISNTIDFPERLKQKIMSRIGNNRLVFRPYKNEELQRILNQRVESTEVFEKNVLGLISKRIAKCSSDIRKCFQILKDSIYLHIKQGGLNQDLKNSKISSTKVTLAYQAIYTDTFNDIYRAMPKIYRQILTILGVYFVRDTKMLPLEQIATIAKNKYKIDQPEVKQTLLILTDLSLVEYKYTLNPSASFRYLKKWNYRLKMEADKVLYASLKFDEDPTM